MTDVATRAPWFRPFARADRGALFVLVVVPTLLFVVPALLGHPAIDADNLIQNFPLRVLAGQQIAAGHLPLLDPLTNSGTPLLGGMNAGALYPLTILFAVTPAMTAWIINMIAVYVTASLGLYALLRWHGLGPLAAAAAGLSYAYSGAMVGQMVHLGVIQGYSFVPWAVLLYVALSRRLQQLDGAPWRDYWRVVPRWLCGVAVLWGLTFLTGEPRSIAVIELLTLITVPGVLLLRSSSWLTTWRARIVYAATLLVGFLWGLALGLVQLLPGWSFINFSQRSQVSYWFFGAGSLAVRWTTLLFTPDLFGGNGSFGQQAFFANYNLPEVTGYAGVVALTAGAAYLSRLTRRGWRGAHRDFTLYVAIAIVGLFAAWGNFTPLGHLFRAIPLFGSTRLQSRNIILVDFALAVFLGWWLQHVADRRLDEAGLSSRARWLTALPATFVAVFSAALIGWGPSLVHYLNPAVPSTFLERHLQVIDAIYLVLGLAALATLGWARRSRHFVRVVLALLAADLIIFLAFSATGLIGGASPREASRAQATALFGTQGRFALVDNGGAHTTQYRTLGEPNMNVFTGLASVQGYGALISTIYDDATGTHPQTQLNPCRLADGTFAQLRLDAVAISQGSLSNLEGVPQTHTPMNCVVTVPARRVPRYYGQLLHVASLSVELATPLPATAVVTVRALSGGGHAVGPVVTLHGRAHLAFTLPSSTATAGFVLTSTTPITIASSSVTTSGVAPTTYVLDNPFQLAIATSHWRLASTEPGFSVFKATALRPRAWLVSATTASRVTQVRTAPWGDAWISVNVVTSSVLVRSEAYLPGWRATALNVRSGASLSLPVHRDGLVESVRVPKGEWIVHFHYHAPYIEVSSATSLAALVLLVGAAVTAVLRRSRRSKTKVPA